jgi:tetratricopeptide (TPR) repeat protein
MAEAGKVGEEILAKDPNNKQLIMQMASIYLEQEQTQKALEMLESANARGLLTDAKEMRQLYQMYNYAEQPEKAAAVIKAAVAKGTLKEDFETYKGLAESYALAADAAPDESAKRKEMFTEAVAAYGKAAQYATDGEMDFQRGQLMIQETENLAEGKKAMEAAIAKGGLKREGEAYVLLGNAEFELGNTQGAIAAFTKAKNYPSTKSMAEQWLKSVQQR